MGTAYLVALFIGLGTIVVQLLLSSDKNLDADTDLGGEAELTGDAENGHADLDHGLSDADHLHGDASGSGMAPLAVLLSLRFWTFSLMAFGLFGSFIHFLDLASRWPALGAATLMGALSGWLASWSFYKLTHSTPNSGAESTELVGQLGKVMLPTNTEGRAKVRLRVKGQLIDYLATTDSPLIEPGASVLVEEVRGNQVHVSPAPAGLKYSE